MKKIGVTFMGIIVISLLAGSAALVAAQDSEDVAATPAKFSGSLEPGPSVAGGYSPTMRAMTDPRLDGTVYYSGSGIETGSIEYGWHTYRIVTDHGAWQGSLPHLYDEQDEALFASTTGHLVGEGEYEGLTAIAELDFGEGEVWTLRGVIVDAGSMPAPPPPAGNE